MPKTRYNKRWKKKWQQQTGEDYDGSFEGKTYWKKYRVRAAFEKLCEGKNKAGQPCKKLAQPGGRFCASHGRGQ